MKKKILIGVLAVFVLVVGFLMLLPVFYSVDDARPEILKAINQQVSGEVSIDKLSLRVFPSLRFRIKGLRAAQKGYTPENWLEIDSIDVDLALWSLLAGPKGKIVVHGPKLSLMKGPEGKFNVEEFLVPKKSSSGSAALNATPPAGATPPPSAGTPPASNVDPKAMLDALPSWVKGLIYAARLKVQIDDGALQFSDPTLLGKNDKVALSHLEILFKNIGLDTPMELETGVGFDVQYGDISLKGPFEGSGTLQIVPVAKGIKLKVDLDESLDKTELRFSNLFRKAAGRALGAKITGAITAVDGALNVDLTGLEARLDKSRVGGTMKLSNFSALAMGDLDLKLGSNDLDLRGFGVLVPMIADYKLEGKTDFSLSALGNPMNPAILLKMDLKNVGGSTPQLQRPLKNLSGKISVAGTPTNPSIVVGPLTMGLGSSDISTSLTAKGLKPTRVEASVESRLINADELLGLEALRLDADAKPKSKAKSPEEPAPKTAKGKGKPAPLDESLAALEPVINEALKNPALDLAELDFKARINDLVLLGADFSQLQSGMSYHARTFKIEGAHLEAYNGKLDANVQVGLKDALTYNLDSKLNGVDFGQVLETHMPTWKDTLTGAMTGSAALSGKGVSKADLEKNLRGSFKGTIADGSFKLPLGKLMGTLMSSLPKSVAKIAKVSGASKAKGSLSGDFRTMELDAKIVGREIVLEKMDVAYDPKKGTDMRFTATGTVSFDQKLNLIGKIMVNPDQVDWEGIDAFVGKSGMAEIPVKVKGTMENPEPDYTYTAGFIGKQILKDKAVGVAADAIKKALGEKKSAELGDMLGGKKKLNLKKLKKLFK
jgi:uncharacterized protein involved in outer membrane biogenesis